MKNLTVSIMLVLLFSVPAFSKNLKDSGPQPKTKIEQFSITTGVVIIRGFQTIGSVQGMHGTSINVEAKEFTNVAVGKKEYGITVEVKKEDGRYDKEHKSYIDYDEISSLINGINYIAKVKTDVTSLHNFQADYSTKGDLKISTFNTSGGRLMAAVSSGNIGGVGAYFNISDLEKVKALIVQAKEKIDSIK